MKKRTKILATLGAISAGVVGIFGGYKALVDNKYRAVAMYGVVMTPAEEIEDFNRQFLNCQGRQRGSTIKALIQMIKANNAYSERRVKVNDLEDNVDISAILEKVDSSRWYEVELKYDTEGVICVIIITEVN